MSIRVPGLRGKLPPKYPIGSCAGPLGFVHTYATLPTPPLSGDVSGGIVDWQMLGNGPDPTLTVNDGNPVGDCAFAGFEHYRMAKAAAGAIDETFETSNQLVTDYLAYDDGQDEGANLADLLAFWYKAGEILGYAPVDVRDRLLVNAAMLAFHGVYTGVQLPQVAEQQFANHEPWRVTGDPDEDQPVGGHCILQVAYSPHEDTYVTWGTIALADANWSTRNRDEGWVVIGHEDAAAANLDIDALRADIESLHGIE